MGPHSCLSGEQDGNTALIVSADRGDAECVKALITAGADCDARNIVRCVPTQLQACLRQLSLGLLRSKLSVLSSTHP